MNARASESKRTRSICRAQPSVAAGNDDIPCCGLREVCERKLLRAAREEVEYYDDEELDAYRGRSADSYTEAEVEEFRYVLYTMREDEVAGWVRSLQLRQVELPDGLRDEVIMIVGDPRQ